MHPCPGSPGPIVTPAQVDSFWYAIFDITWPEGYTIEEDYVPGPWPDIPFFDEWWRGQRSLGNYLLYEHPASEVNYILPSGWTDVIRIGATSGGYRPHDPAGYWEPTALPPRVAVYVEVCQADYPYSDPQYGAAVARWAKASINGWNLEDGRRCGLSYVGVVTDMYAEGGPAWLPEPFQAIEVQELTTLSAEGDPVGDPVPVDEVTPPE